MNHIDDQRFTRAAVALPETGFVRLPAILGDKKSGMPGVIPMGKTAWWNGVKAGRFPQPVKLGANTTAWRVEDIRELIERTSTRDAA